MVFERTDSHEPILRSLIQDDLARLVRMDEAITGRSRATFYEGRLDRALHQSHIQISLGAELDGCLVGAVLGSLQYGEFGVVEPVAVLDTILVDPEFGGQGVGAALFDQLWRNLRGLRVERVRTEVSWSEQPLMGFLATRGFAPVPRLVLEHTL